MRPYLLIPIILLVILGISLYQKNVTSGNPKVNVTSTATEYPEIADLKSRNLNFEGLKTYFTDLAEKKGAVYAYDVLKVAPIGPNIDMHLLGHVVGDVLYKQQGVSGIKVCTQDFRNACSHTIVVGLLTDKGEAALDEIRDACEKAPGGKGAYTMCFHGLGHGVLAYTGYDLPKAIQLCEKTGTASHNNREYIECVGGSIMEIISGGFHAPELWAVQSKKYLSSDDPLSPCNSDFMPDVAKPICYTYLTPHLFIAAGADIGHPDSKYYPKAFGFCNAISLNDIPSRSACFGGFGKEFTTLAKDRDIRDIGSMNEDQLKKVYGWCQLAGDSQGTRDCISQALQSLFWGGENNPDASVKFCSIMDDSSLQSSCFEELVGAASYYLVDPNAKRNFCQKFPPNYIKSCQSKLS